MKLGYLAACAIVAGASAAAATQKTDNLVLETSAYQWVGDTIRQGEFKAWAVSPEHIVSTYSARPHYYMPVEKEWRRKNDLSKYPRLSGSNRLLEAVYNMGLDEMVNAVEPDTTLRTGKEWAGVWTRDVSYSIILSMAYMQPEAAMISLMKKVNRQGQIIQDTGSGGAWPISTDRMVWALAAWEIYKVTGDMDWLRKVYPIIQRSVAKDQADVYSDNGLVMGETSFIDWREQSYPRWMQTADIAESEAMGTNMVHAASLDILSQMAAILGRKDEAKAYRADADRLAGNINDLLWDETMGDYVMFTYGRDSRMNNRRYETLGSSLAILYGIASPEQARTISERHPVTPYGTAIFFPQIADVPNYHNNALWPFVASYWALANAKAGNEPGTLEAIGSVVRPAALFATNKENFNLDNGDIYTELNSSNMLWSLSGNIALTTRILFGIQYEPGGLAFRPFVPKALADTRTLSNFPYRGASLDITVSGYGDSVKELTLNGKRVKGTYIPAKDLKGACKINIVMADNDIAPLQVNRTPNVMAPLTPSARLSRDGKRLEWNPIEYIGEYVLYLDGREVARTRTTDFEVDGRPGMWQVAGVSSDGVEGFASEPIFTGEEIVVQIPGENLVMVSPEISYPAKEAIAGYTGSGFVETDHHSPAIEIPVDIAPGTYFVELRYANGNGPVNTENKAAVRSLTVDGRKVGTFVMPTRGVANWNDWGRSTSFLLDVPGGEGEHVLKIELLDDDENMNLKTNHALVDALIIRKY